MSLLRQYRRYPKPDLARYLTFVVAGRHVGWVTKEFSRRLAARSDIFAVGGSRVSFADGLGSVASRTASMEEFLNELRAEGLLPGWRGELYPVNTTFHEPPLLLVERAAAPLFGLLAYGINVNGFVDRGWSMKVWVARRAATKSVDPGMRDVMVGGGLPAGLSPFDNLVKECREEAGIPPAIARTALPVGLITLFIEAKEGLRAGLQFNYDLELPADFVPGNTDGEVAGFELIPVSDLIHALRSAEDFMFDVALVKLDFLVRHGFIGPDHPEYLALIAGLRRPIPFAHRADA
jgi:8-oxo-dGTP pyrophosphatase MutT (NUDIX family)